MHIEEIEEDDHPTSRPRANHDEKVTLHDSSATLWGKKDNSAAILALISECASNTNYWKKNTRWWEPMEPFGIILMQKQFASNTVMLDIIKQIAVNDLVNGQDRKSSTLSPIEKFYRAVIAISNNHHDKTAYGTLEEIREDINKFAAKRPEA